MIRLMGEKYRRMMAVVMMVVMVITNIGTNLVTAYGAGENTSSLFLIDGEELSMALKEAKESGDVFDYASLELTAKSKGLKSSYDKLLGTGAVYELDADVDERYAADGTGMRIFYNAGTEAVVFLFINESDMDVTFRANVDGYETARVTVNPTAEAESEVEAESGVSVAEGISKHEVDRVGSGLESVSTASNADAEITYDRDDEDGQLLEDDSIENRGYLSGKAYNTVTIWTSANARAFRVSAKDLKGVTSTEGMYQVDYSVDPIGAAVFKGADEVAEDENLYFAVEAQVGYEVVSVTANGVELEEIDAEDIASDSDAEIAADSDEHTHLYEVEEVSEDLEIVAELVEVDGMDHPAFQDTVTINGVTITASAEEGIIPEGTVLEAKEVTAQVESAVKEKYEESEGESVTTVLAYDINLMLNGRKLNNTWGREDENFVKVEFSGERIAEAGKEAEQLQVVTLETPTETVDAALGGTEEMAVVDDVTADQIEINTEGREAVDVSGEAAIESVNVDAKHFSVYAVIGTVGDMTTKVSKYSARFYKLYGRQEKYVTLDGVRYAFEKNQDVTFTATSSDAVATVTVGNVSAPYQGEVYYNTKGTSYEKVDHFTVTMEDEKEVVYAVMENGVKNLFAKKDSTEDEAAKFCWLPESIHIKAKVYARFNGPVSSTKLAESIPQDQFGPDQKSEKGYATVDVDMTSLLKHIKADYKDYEVSYDKKYLSYIFSPNAIEADTTAEYNTRLKKFYTDYIWDYIAPEDQKKMNEIVTTNYYGYVLKCENDGWHIDGYFDRQYYVDIYRVNNQSTKADLVHVTSEAEKYQFVQNYVAERCKEEVSDLKWATSPNWTNGAEDKKSTAIFYDGDGKKYEATILYGNYFSVNEELIQYDPVKVTGLPEKFDKFEKFDNYYSKFYYSIIPLDKVTATKTWIGGGTTKPDTWFQLWRTAEGSEASEPVDKSLVKLPQPSEEGVTEVTWNELPMRDKAEKQYTYFVQEVDAEGNDYVPTGYTKEENGLTVVNTLQSVVPQSVTLKKILESGSDELSADHAFTFTITAPNQATTEITILGEQVGEEVSIQDQLIQAFGQEFGEDVRLPIGTYTITESSDEEDTLFELVSIRGTVGSQNAQLGQITLNEDDAVVTIEAVNKSSNTGEPDGGDPGDGGTPDGGDPGDGGTPDGGNPGDEGTPDGGTPDAGTPDAGGTPSAGGTPNGGGNGTGSSGPGSSAGTPAGGPGTTTTTTINPEAVPLAGLPKIGTEDGGEDQLITIDEADVPLAALPKTGDASQAAVLFFMISGMMLTLGAMFKKKEEQ